MTRRRCVIVGGGPAGLYLAIELARQDAGFTVDVYDDAAASGREGVGIVLDAAFVDGLVQRDPVSGSAVAAASQSWDTVRLRIGDEQFATGGHRIYGVSRAALVETLRERAASLRVRVREQRAKPSQLAGECAVLVGADGAASAVRGWRAKQHGVSLSDGRTRYLWMRAEARLPAGFCFLNTPHGAYVAHTYPYTDSHSAVVVECRPATLAAAGLIEADRGHVERALERLFADHLGRAPLAAATFPWRAFRTVRTARWHIGHQILIGDAAHTTHFSAGSGTRLAIEDAVTLAAQLASQPHVTQAAARYEAARRPPVTALQADGHGSQLWFEDLDRHLALPPYQLAFALRTRRDVNTFRWLRERDPGFVERVMAIVRADRRTVGAVALDGVAPRKLPLRLGTRVLPSRAVSLDSLAAITAERANFVVVPAGAAGGRVERTLLAEELRNRDGHTVLLWAPGLPADEADTLIAAGRIDGYIDTSGDSQVPA